MTSASTDVPRVSNVARRVGCTDLVGRQTELKKMRSLLKSGSRVLLCQNDAQARGLGRSRLALEYALVYANQYQVIWRLDCQQSAVLAANFAELAIPLALPQRVEDDQRVIIDAVRDWLGRSKDWLLILEDVDDWSHLKRILPEAYDGHVIVTSAALKSERSFGTIELAGLSDESMVELLSGDRDADNHEASRLGKYLHGIPQLLQLASSYCAMSSTSFGDLQSRLLADLSAAGVEEDSEMSSQAKLRIMLGLVLSLAGKKNPVARDLLALCAFFDSEGISFAQISQGTKCYSRRLREASQEASAIVAIAQILCDYGLAELYNDSLSIHPQIQKAIRAGMNEEPRAAWANAALRCVLCSFPIKMDYEHPSDVCNQLMPHALVATQHTMALDIAPEDTGYLLNQVALYLHGCNEYDEAGAAYKSAILLAEKAYGHMHAAVATRTNSLGVTFQETGDLEKARECYQTAFDICAEVFGPISEAIYGPAHDTMLTMPIKNLCNVLKELGDSDGALQTYARAMPIYLKVYGWKHPIVADCANSFGSLWVAQGKKEKGRNCFRKAVAAEEQSEGAAKGNLAVYLNNLGNVLMNLQETEEAYSVFKRALEADRKDFGDTSTQVGRDLRYTGHAARKQRLYGEAQKYYEEALSIIQGIEGDDHGTTAPLLNFLGIVLQAQGKAKMAKGYFERSLALNEKSNLVSPEKLSKDYYNIARSLEDMQEYDEAIVLFEKALELEKNRSEGRTERTATILNRLGRVLNSKGDLPAALEHMERALTVDIKLFGKAHITIARDSFHIGCLLDQMGDTIVAMGHLALALEIYETEYGKGHQKSREARKRLDRIGT